MLQLAIRWTGNVEVVFWLDYLCKGDFENEPFFRHNEIFKSADLYQMLIEDRDYKDNRKLKNNFAKLVNSYFKKEGIEVHQDRDKKGTWWKILSGLPQRKLIDPQLISDFLNNKELGYKTEDIENAHSLKLMTYDFNDINNLDIDPKAFKRAVEELINEPEF